MSARATLTSAQGALERAELRLLIVISRCNPAAGK